MQAANSIAQRLTAPFQAVWYYFAFAWGALGFTSYACSVSRGYFANLIAGFFGQTLYSLHQQRTLAVYALIMSLLNLLSGNPKFRDDGFGVVAPLMNIIMLIHYAVEAYWFQQFPPFTLFSVIFFFFILPGFISLLNIQISFGAHGFKLHTAPFAAAAPHQPQQQQPAPPTSPAAKKRN